MEKYVKDTDVQVFIEEAYLDGVHETTELVMDAVYDAYGAVMELLTDELTYSEKLLAAKVLEMHSEITNTFVYEDEDSCDGDCENCTLGEE